MQARYAETPPLLELAQKMHEALEQGISSGVSPDTELLKEFQNLTRLKFFYRGARTMHTNEPKETLNDLERFHELVLAEYGDQPTGGSDQSLGISWNELGNAAFQNNDVTRAEECFLKSIDVLKALDGATGITISMPMVNLGFAYWCQNRLNDAEETFKQALRDREAEYGINDKTSFV